MRRVSKNFKVLIFQTKKVCQNLCMTCSKEKNKLINNKEIQTKKLTRRKYPVRPPNSSA